MDYAIGSIAALISGNVTPNRPKQLKKAKTPIKHQPSPNVTPKSELVEDRSIFLSPTLQKKKAIVKKSPKRIFQNPDLDVTNREDLDSSVLSPKADKVKKHLKDDLGADASSASILLSPRSPKNFDKSPNKANKKRLSNNGTEEAECLVETVFLSAKSLKNDDKSPKKAKRLNDIGNTNEMIPKKKQCLSENGNDDIKRVEREKNYSGSKTITPKKKAKREDLVGEIHGENSPANGDISIKKKSLQNEFSTEETNTMNGNESPKKKKKRNKSRNRNNSQSDSTSNVNSNSAIKEDEKVSEIEESDPTASISASQNMKKKNKKRNKSQQNRNTSENELSGKINCNKARNENEESTVINKSMDNIATDSNANQGTTKKNKKRNKSKQKQNNIQNVNSDTVTNMEVDPNIDKELEDNKNSTNAFNTNDQNLKKRNKKRNKSKQKNNDQHQLTLNVNSDKSNMEVDSDDENTLEDIEISKNIEVIDNQSPKKNNKKKNESKQNNNKEQDESEGNKDVEVNPNAVTTQDTDSEHDSDDEIDSEDEEINKKVLDTGSDANSSDEEPDVRNKKQVLLQRQDGQKTADEESRSEETRDLEEETRRTLFVGNVPFSNKCKRDIKRMFKQYGDVETVRIRTVPAKDARYSPKLAVIKNELHPDRTTVNIYVRFAEESSVQKALVANNSLYNGCHLRVQPSDSLGAPHDARCSIFVGNMPFTMEDEALRTKFEKCGEIESVRIVRDRKTQAGKGFGYVNFKSKDGVELALALTEEDLTIKNRILRVKRCTQATQNQLGRKQKYKNPGKKEPGQAARGNFGQNNRFGKKDNFRPRQEHQGNKVNFGKGRSGDGRNDDKNNGAYRRLMNKRKNQDGSDGPPNKKQHTDTRRDKKERKEFVGITAEKKRKNKFNKGQKKKKFLSEILTK